MSVRLIWSAEKQNVKKSVVKIGIEQSPINMLKYGYSVELKLC